MVTDALNKASTLHELLPIFSRSARMRDHDGSPHNISDREDLIYLFCGHTQLMTLAEMIPDTIVAAEDHACHQSKHLFRCFVQSARFVGVRIQIPQTLQYQVILSQDDVIHPLAVFIEFLYC